MKRAYLDCVNKILKVEINNETFNFRLEGNKTESGSVRTKVGIFVTSFMWVDEIPTFKIIEHSKYTSDLPKGNVNLLMDSWESYTVVLNRGSKADYFGLSFPNGFISYMETYGIMMREAPESPEYDRWTSNKGSIYMLEVIRGWALEFENQHINTQWEDEPTDWDEQVIEYLYLKLRD